MEENLKAQSKKRHKLDGARQKWGKHLDGAFKENEGEKGGALHKLKKILTPHSQHGQKLYDALGVCPHSGEANNRAH